MTGVQTCALQIFQKFELGSKVEEARGRLETAMTAKPIPGQIQRDVVATTKPSPVLVSSSPKPGTVTNTSAAAELTSSVTQTPIVITNNTNNVVNNAGKEGKSRTFTSGKDIISSVWNPRNPKNLDSIVVPV